MVVRRSAGCHATGVRRGARGPFELDLEDEAINGTNARGGTRPLTSPRRSPRLAAMMQRWVITFCAMLGGFGCDAPGDATDQPVALVSRIPPPLPPEECHPLAEECPTGRVCTLNNGIFKCLDGGGKGLLEECSGEYNECNDGLLCLSAGGHPNTCEHAACCSQYCDLDDPVCDPGYNCLAVYETEPPAEPPEGYESLGICAVAQ
jgi:hypothetical protein